MGVTSITHKHAPAVPTPAPHAPQAVAKVDPPPREAGNKPATSARKRTAHVQPAAPAQSVRQEEPAPSLTTSIDAVAAFLTEGESIRDDFIKSGDTELIKRRYGEWNRKVYLALTQDKNLGPSYAVQFQNIHGNAMMGSPSGRSVEGGGYWQEIGGKDQFLIDLITELRRRN
jgi:hypothetical protein